MPFVQCTIDVAAPARAVYDLAKEQERFPEFMPDVEIVVVLETARPMSATDRALVELFCSRLSVAFDNVILYDQLHEANIRLEERVRAELGLALAIDAVAPGGLLSRARLTRVERVSKPRPVGHAKDASAPPLTLDTLMEDL